MRMSSFEWQLDLSHTDLPGSELPLGACPREQSGMKTDQVLLRQECGTERGNEFQEAEQSNSGEGLQISTSLQELWSRSSVSDGLIAFQVQEVMIRASLRGLT
ncbi:unnamed protein product [Pleuronectes platessa]|uniref:Uncharacterized protein n=1 Tax=Pleuronectes platessa TaxID=8262 RepID=A0A9N7Y6M5_PLEPL|nr:unnamed protein product [Pleuronectes platessa]